MAKHNHLTISIIAILIMVSCTKKETITQEYNPPQPKLFGTWKLIANSVDTSYYQFPDNGSNYFHILTISKDGFKFKQTNVYSATDRQLFMNSSLSNYKISGDTLLIYQSPTTYTMYLKSNRVDVDFKTWLSPMTRLKTIDLPRGFATSPHPFGIDGDFIMFYGKDPSNERIYKYNTSSLAFEDSVSVSKPASVCFLSGKIYVAFDQGNYNLFKGDFTGLNTVSTNTISYPKAVSVNANSGVVYVLNDSYKLLSGTDNSNFNELFDFNPYGCYNILYYKNDEFLCLQNGLIHRIKIVPNMKVLESFEALPNLYIYQISTNGSDIWAYCYDNVLSAYKLVKISM